MVNGFAQSVAHLPRDPTFARRDLSSIRRGNLYPILPDDVRPADPELRHAMLGMTETGSVCLASDDESDLPEHQRGSFGRPAPGFEARVVDPDTRRAAARSGASRASSGLRGPFLMEGYYGRERHEVFDADGWFRTGDLVRRRRGRLLLLPGTARRHDQDQRRQRVAARGRSRDPRSDRAHRARDRDRGRGARPARGRGQSACRATAPSTSTSCGAGSPSASPPTRCRGASSLLARRRGPAAVERQARPAGARGALRCSLTHRRFPAILALRRRRRCGTAQALVSDESRVTYAELDDAQPRAGQPHWSEPGSARATASAC